MARPKREINEAQIKALMRLKPTLADTAAYFECSERTIERFIRSHFKLSFVEFREQNMVHTRLSLVRKAIGKAEAGDNVMLIFCLKNLCEWRDKPAGDADVNVNLAGLTTKSDAEIDTRIEQLMSEHDARKKA